jgi:hypothetical protein
MQLVLKRILKIDPLNLEMKDKKISQTQYPFEMFKILISNLNIYTTNRDKRMEIGK